jgi:thioredoxin reductase (NADPH)
MTERAIIIGSGPAGYAAATYMARAQIKPLMLAGEKSGGQLMLTTEIENYPGFPQGIMGPDLMIQMREQAERFGTVIKDVNVAEVKLTHWPFTVYTGAEAIEAEAVLLTTGAESIPLGVPGELDYTGRGVSYCAVCDAAFFKDKRVFVVGGGDAAMEDTLALIKFAQEITIIHRRDSFKASKIMQERVLGSEKVKVWWNTVVEKVKGDGMKVTHIALKNTESQEAYEVPADGVFVAIGHKPATGFLGGQVELDEKGYVKTGITYDMPAHRSSLTKQGEHLWLSGYPTMTNIPGVFAAGDNVDFRYRQAASAAGMGVMAALDLEWWLERK